MLEGEPSMGFWPNIRKHYDATLSCLYACGIDACITICLCIRRRPSFCAVIEFENLLMHAVIGAFCVIAEFLHTGTESRRCPPPPRRLCITCPTSWVLPWTIHHEAKRARSDNPSALIYSWPWPSQHHSAKRMSCPERRRQPSQKHNAIFAKLKR